MYYLLTYEKHPGYESLQLPHQSAHLDHVMAAAGRGELILAGSLEDPVDGSALMVFKSDSPQAARDFANSDPYVTGGVISKWSIRKWDVVVS